MSELLHATQVGERGSWVVFCHGLFGQGKNWTGIAKGLVDQHRCLLLDMPNHGRSPWSDDVSYAAMADAVAETLEALASDAPIALVGHSMGGKIAMLVALRRPDLVERLVVVDVSPAASDAQAGFGGYVAAMRAIDLAALARRAEAEEQLRDAVPEASVRGFLLQNLRHDPSAPPGEQWRWQLNLDVLRDHLAAIGEWPDPGDVRYDGPVLWIAGSHSDYVLPEHAAAMSALFPRVRRVAVKDAGHWVHSEQPAVFLAVLRRFLDAGPTPSHTS